MTVRTLTRPRPWALLAAAGVLAICGTLALVLTSSGSAATPTPTPEPSASPSATAEPSPIVEAQPSPADLPPDPKQAEIPFQPKEETPPPPPPALLRADRVVVATGDGDCLNVRPAPTTLFEADPRFCAPEGTALWLHGDTVEADGERWRYALGLGWVAARYLKDVPDAAGPVELKSGLVTWQQYGEQINVTTLDASGSVVARTTFPYVQQLGTRPPLMSDDGAFVAVTNYRENGDGDFLLVGDTKTGATTDLGRAIPLGWSGERFLYMPYSCGGDCTYSLAWYSPYNISGAPLLEEQARWMSAAWAPDGRSVLAFADGARLLRLGLDGAQTDLGITVPDDQALGTFVVSPDGKRLLSGNSLGPIRMLDLTTGAISQFKRAEQQEVGGRCGGSVGQAALWLSSNRFAYHEGYALQKGNNGITIGNPATGARSVVPMFGVTDIQLVSAKLATFTTWEWLNDKGFPITWALDLDTFETYPLVTGGGAVLLP